MSEWFKARLIWRKGIEELSDAEAGRFVKALWKYAATGEVENLSGGERFVFAMCSATLEQDWEERSDLSAVRSKAGKKGGRPKKANESKKTICFFEKANESKITNCPHKDIRIDDEEDTRTREGFITDDEADEIMAGHQRVYDEAQRCGFDLNTGTLDALTALIGQYGADRMMDALTVCLEHSAKSLAYLRKVLEGKPKAAANEPPRLSRLF